MGDPSYKVEYAKALSDYFKHLTTLSTGAIILIPAFLEKVFTNPICKHWVTYSLIAFIGSVVATTVVYALHLIWAFPRNEKDDQLVNSTQAYSLAIGLVIAWAGFLIGIISLGVFVVSNLNQPPKIQ